MICVQTVVSSGIVLANMPLGWLASAWCIALILAGGLTFVLLTLVPARLFDPAEADRRDAERAAAQARAIASGEPGVSPRKRLWALLLALLGFFGPSGLHRFYVGKIGTGIVWLVTFGIFGIGTVIDCIVIACGGFRDALGRRVLRWEDEPLSRDDLATARAEAGVIPAPGGAFDKMSGAVRDTFRGVNASAAGARAAQLARTAGGGILSALAALFLFSGTVVALAVAVDVPGMIDAGRPSPAVKRELLNGLAELNWVSPADRPPGAARQRTGASAAPARGRTFDLEGVRAQELTIDPEARQVAAGRADAPTDRSDAGQLTGIVDRFAAEMQQQFSGFDRDLARAIVQRTRDAAQGDMGLTRASVEIRAAMTATMAARDALRALEEARRSLAELEGARSAAYGAVAGPAAATALAPIVPFAPTTLIEPSSPAAPPYAVEVYPEIAVSLEAARKVVAQAPGARAAGPAGARAVALRRGNDLGSGTEFASGGDDGLPSVAAPLRVIGVLASGTLYVVGLALLTLARRSYGPAHLVRGVAGVACLIAASMFLYRATAGTGFWAVTSGERIELVAREALRTLNSPPAYAAAAMLLAAILLSAWPPRRREFLSAAPSAVASTAAAATPADAQTPEKGA
jgi:hypothetical protein